MRSAKWFAAVVLLAGIAAPAAAQIGTPPAFFCGRTYAFAKGVPNGTVLANQASAVRVETYHFLDLVEFNNQCPGPPYTLTMSASLNCDEDPSSGPVTFGPFALDEGHDVIEILVPVPAGPARECALVITATLTLTDGTQIAQTADQHVSVQDGGGAGEYYVELHLMPDPNDPLAPASVVQAHPGDVGAMRYRVHNAHPTQTFSGELVVDARNVADTPDHLAGTNDTARGNFARSDPLGRMPARVTKAADAPDDYCAFDRDVRTEDVAQPPDVCVPVVVPPLGFADVELCVRHAPLTADGAATECTARLAGQFDDGTPASASAGAVIVANHAAPPNASCATSSCTVATAVADSIPAGPAVGIVGNTPGTTQSWQVNFALDRAATQILVNGQPVTASDFSTITQIDGQHGRCVADLSFLNPPADPNATITLVTEFVCRRDNSSSGEITADLRDLGLVVDEPAGYEQVAPYALGRVDVTSVNGFTDATLDFVQQFSAVGVETGTFQQVAMNNLSTQIEIVSADRYVVTSTWTAAQPGTATLIGFDLSSDFRAVTRLGDFDGDGVPNDTDNEPFFYNSDQSIPFKSLAVDQVDFYNTDDSPLLLNSDYGMFGIATQNLGATVAYVNAEINGVWHIRNMPVTGVDCALHTPIETHYTMFGIGARGVDVTGTPASVRATLTTAPLLFGVPAAVPAQVVSTGDTPRQPGDAGSSNPPATPGPAEGAGAFDRPPGRETPIRAVRPQFEMIDLDGPEDAGSCVPGAVTSSFRWLNRTYCLGLPDGPGTADAMLAEFKQRFGSGPIGQTFPLDVPDGKAGFIRSRQLPLTIEGQGDMIPTGTPSTPVNPADLFRQLQLGQDVEVSLLLESDSGRVTGHTAAVVAMTKEGDQYTITFLDDARQSRPGFNDRRTTGKIVPDGQFWIIENSSPKRTFRGWIAESPTQAAVNRAARLKAAAVRDLLDALGGAATLAEGQELIRRAHDIEFLAGVLRAHTANGGRTTDPPAVARGIEDAARRLRRHAIRVTELVGPPQTQELLAARAVAQGIVDLTDEFEALFPPDADYDGVPDDVDNAPLYANPDQADCNADGVGDVIQLDGNDCNFNGVPDDCDVATGGGSEDVNRNGVPDECECVGDLDGDDDVDLADLSIVLARYGSSDPLGDVDNDGDVDLGDLSILLARYGAICG